MVEPFNTGFPRSLLASCRMTGLRQPFASPARRKRPFMAPRFQNRATALAHHIKRGALSWVLWAPTELAGAVIAACVSRMARSRKRSVWTMASRRSNSLAF
jgi:hypothetical protein